MRAGKDKWVKGTKAECRQPTTRTPRTESHAGGSIENAVQRSKGRAENLAEREGFEPSVQVLARTTVLAIVDSLAMPRNPKYLQSHSLTKTHIM